MLMSDTAESSGPSDWENSITSLYDSSGTVTHSGIRWAVTSTGTTFIDNDADGYYDWAFNREGYYYDASTGTWTTQEDIEANDISWDPAYDPSYAFPSPNETVPRFDTDN